ncbi:MAG: FAD-dependent oxidoreductase, partial [Chloroflexi bacterium]|nr:FAD-dependent oxidoreductase [Chloroflexota bacterium]
MKNKAEVVVVGGGVMGCSILYNLARRGVTDALLVEREALGAGSTGRSSGVV